MNRQQQRSKPAWRPDFARAFKILTWWFNGIMVALIVLFVVVGATSDCDGDECLGPALAAVTFFVIWVVGNLAAFVIEKLLAIRTFIVARRVDRITPAD